MGEHLCIVPNVEPEFSRMPIFKSRAKNSSYEGWYADIDTAVILEINRLGRFTGVTTCSQLYVMDADTLTLPCWLLPWSTAGYH